LRVLLDTHALLWWLLTILLFHVRLVRLLPTTKNTVLVSAASAWEIATKVRLGKLPTAANLVSDFLRASRARRLRFAGDLRGPWHSRRPLTGTSQDPFDRMLIAQAQAENLPVITNERVFEAYGVRRLW